MENGTPCYKASHLLTTFICYLLSFDLSFVQISFFIFIHRDRLAEQESLCQLHTAGAENGKLLLRLNSLCHDLYPHLPSQLHNRAYDSPGLGIVHYIIHHTFVQLQNIEFYC